MESYWFAAVPFQSMPVPVFIGLPRGSSSQALYVCGKAARTKCLGNTGLLQSHKHTAVCSRATVHAPQPARLPASLMPSWQKCPALLWITKPLRWLLYVRWRIYLFFHPLPTVRTCRSCGRFPGGRYGHHLALSALSPRESPGQGHVVPGWQHPGDSFPLTSPPAGLLWPFPVFFWLWKPEHCAEDRIREEKMDEQNFARHILEIVVPGREAVGSSIGILVLPVSWLSFIDCKAKITSEPTHP